MNELVAAQLKELETKRKERLERIKEISDQVRKIAEEVEKTKKASGIATLEDEKILEKRISHLDFKISTAKNLPLKLEKEIASKIGALEKRLQKVRAARASSKSLKELENKIRDLKNERDKIKKELDKDAEEIEELKEDMKTVSRRQVKEAAIEHFTLGDIAEMKRKK